MSIPKARRAALPSRHSYGGQGKPKASRATESVPSTTGTKSHQSSRTNKKHHSSRSHASSTRPKPRHRESSAYNARDKYYLSDVDPNEVGFQPRGASATRSEEEWEPEEEEDNKENDKHAESGAARPKRNIRRPSAVTRGTSYLGPKATAARAGRGKAKDDSTGHSKGDSARHGKSDGARHGKSDSSRHHSSKPSASRSSRSPEKKVQIKEAPIEYRPGMNEHDPWKGFARCAFEAGAMAALRARNTPGAWMGAKGTKVVAAALGAAVVDTVLERKAPEKKGGMRHAAMRHFTEAAIANMVIGPLAKSKGSGSGSGGGGRRR